VLPSTLKSICGQRYGTVATLQAQVVVAKLVGHVGFLVFYQLVCRLFYGLYKLFCGLERRNKMLWYIYGHILLDVATHFCSTLLEDETTEAANINRFSFNKRCLYFLKKGFERYKDIYFRDSCFLGDAAYDVCFPHGLTVLKCERYVVEKTIITPCFAKVPKMSTFINNQLLNGLQRITNSLIISTQRFIINYLLQEQKYEENETEKQ